MKPTLKRLINNDPTLTTLNTRYNHIGATGAKTIADTLIVNSTITTLHISGNNIGDTGAITIADSLIVNSTLTTLYLSGNNIGETGAKSIADSLIVNTTLTDLHLGLKHQEKVNWITTRNKSNKHNKESSLVDLLYNYL